MNTFIILIVMLSWPQSAMGFSRASRNRNAPITTDNKLEKTRKRMSNMTGEIGWYAKTNTPGILVAPENQLFFSYEWERKLPKVKITTRATIAETSIECN
jgi:hypothetical protein